MGAAMPLPLTRKDRTMTDNLMLNCLQELHAQLRGETIQPTKIDTAKYTAHKNPGKFEGETSATEYFWELVMNGDGETWSPNMNDSIYSRRVDVFTVDADEAETWPNEFKIGDTVIIWECPQGFVTLCAYGTRDAAERHVKSWMGIVPELAPTSG